MKFLVQPVLNPDGYSYTWTNDRMWRKNRVQNQGSRCMGVDLNRNYEANWSGPGASANPCSESYYGTSEFSELESSNQRDYLDPYIKDGSMKAFLTFHSYGLVLPLLIVTVIQYILDNTFYIHMLKTIHLFHLI